MASYGFMTIGSGNGLLSDGTKPLQTKVDLSSAGSSDIDPKVKALACRCPSFMTFIIWQGKHDLSFNESMWIPPWNISSQTQKYNLIFRDTKYMFTILPYTYYCINQIDDQLVPNKHKAVFDWQSNRELWGLCGLTRKQRLLSVIYMIQYHRNYLDVLLFITES